MRKHLKIDFSKAEGVLWSDTIIEKYQDDWDWRWLSRNSSIKWTNERIEKFERYIDFEQLSYNTNLRIESDMLDGIIDRYSDRWNWNALSGNPAIAKNLDLLYEILMHPKAVWVSEPYWKYGRNLQSLNEIYLTNNLGRTWGIKPCICTNPEIKWDLREFNIHKEKLDFWLLALFAKIDIDIIYKFGQELNVNREYDISFTRTSDWHDQHPVHRNGWENWLNNRNTRVNLDTLIFLKTQDITLIKYDGNARDGHKPYEIHKCVNEIIPAEKIDLSFEELCSNLNLLPKNLITDTVIENNIFNYSRLYLL